MTPRPTKPILPTPRRRPERHQDLLQPAADRQAKAQTDTIVNGIRMAIDEDGGKIAGDLKIEYEDRTTPTAADGQWTAERETANANKAMQPTRT